ncbi:MAG TPA: hypothetical protein VMG31_12240 [Verrucomicrobiae bacterium]|nr:hypothetical protein [Verrucomicrobiae bacterium]
MRSWQIFGVALVATLISVGARASPFVVFPRASELISPDGRYVVRNVERAGPGSDFIGTFHSLWLTEVSTGRTRKLCDYFGVAVVGWSNNDILLVTQYWRKGSRALVLSAAGMHDPLVLDAPGLFPLVPGNLRPSLRENDHVFVEASRIEEETLHLIVWGYGKHDANGFRWHCDYALLQGTVSCQEKPQAVEVRKP